MKVNGNATDLLTYVYVQSVLLVYELKHCHNSALKNILENRMLQQLLYMSITILCKLFVYLEYQMSFCELIIIMFT